MQEHDSLCGVRKIDKESGGVRQSDENRGGGIATIELCGAPSRNSSDD